MNKVFIFALIALLGLFFVQEQSSFKNTEILTACTCDSLQDMISWAEGKKSCVYKDSKGIATIGIGFNLERGDAASILNGMGINYNDVLTGKRCLSESEISSVFNRDIVWAKDGARQCVPSFSQHSQCIQNVLVDMTFNMGKSSLCNWPNFVKQLASKQYTDAASNVAGTAYCKQVGRRCTRNVELIRCG